MEFQLMCMHETKLCHSVMINKKTENKEGEIGSFHIERIRHDVQCCQRNLRQTKICL
jgi:hypothetical protein